MDTLSEINHSSLMTVDQVISTDVLWGNSSFGNLFVDESTSLYDISDDKTDDRNVIGRLSNESEGLINLLSDASCDYSCHEVEYPGPDLTSNNSIHLFEGAKEEIFNELEVADKLCCDVGHNFEILDESLSPQSIEDVLSPISCPDSVASTSTSDSVSDNWQSCSLGNSNCASPLTSDPLSPICTRNPDDLSSFQGKYRQQVIAVSISSIDGKQGVLKRLGRNKELHSNSMRAIQDMEENRHSRKKHQNKIAASRYRKKKRKEREQLEEEAVDLEKRNQCLKMRLVALVAEVGKLRKLLGARGLLKQSQLDCSDYYNS